MKLIHLSTFDKKGGAAKAAFKIHKSLSKSHNSKMFVLLKESNDETVFQVKVGFLKKLIATKFDGLLRRLVNFGNYGYFSSGLFGTADFEKNADVLKADAIILYWVNFGFLSIRSLGRLFKLKKPIIWRMSDTWPFSSGLHYASEFKENDMHFRMKLLCRIVFFIKKNMWCLDNLVVVSPSKWMDSKVKNSKLFEGVKSLVIHTGVDIDVFCPQDKNACRKFFNIPNKKVILFGAVNATSDYRKGGDLLFEALEYLKQEANGGFCCVVFGDDERYVGLRDGIDFISVGKINSDQELSMLYNCADVFVAPSREENLANTVLEAQSCHIPTVAFDVGGMPEAIDNLKTGVLVSPYSVDLLSKAIFYCISNSGQFKGEFFESFRTKFDQNLKVSEYISLINSFKYGELEK